MDIKRNGSQPSGKGPAEYFTGTVRIDPLFQTSDPARGLAASVTFEPCARKAWRHANQAITHIAIVEQLNGKAVEWMEKVTDDEYFAHKPRDRSQ